MWVSFQILLKKGADVFRGKVWVWNWKGKGVDSLVRTLVESLGFSISILNLVLEVSGKM